MAVYGDVHAVPLALHHYPADGVSGDPQPPLDSGGMASSHSGGLEPVLPFATDFLKNKVAIERIL